MNINKIINYERPKQTYYDILGCARSSSPEQISREYKIRALQLHPDKTNSDPSCNETFKLIQLAKDTLGDEASRKSYDCWLDSNINIPFEQWQLNKGHSMHWGQSKSRKLCINQPGANAHSPGNGKNKTSNDETSRFGQGSESKFMFMDTSQRSAAQVGQSSFVGGHQRDCGSQSLLSKFRNYEI